MNTIRRGILILSMAWTLAAPAAQSPEELVSAAEREEKVGAFEKAIALYTTFLKDNPDHIQCPTIQYRLALCYDSIGQLEPTIEHLKASVAVPPDKALGKYRQDAYMKLARLYSDCGTNKLKEAADTLNVLLKEGAGLYEDEAQLQRAGYLALLGQHDEAIVLFNVLCNKPNADTAKNARYKLVIVLLKDDKLDMAKNAIEAFVQHYPGDVRIGELFIRIARAYFEKKQFKSAMDVCQQVLGEFKDAPEAVEAAFISGLIYRENKNYDKAIDCYLNAARMPQSVHNAVLVSEALFECAQIYRKQLKQMDRAADFYHEAAIKSRDPVTERQQNILEQSLFFEAEIYLKQEKWNVAFDLYAQLQKAGSKLNVIERMIYCKSKMSANGDASMNMESEAELAVIRKRIADNPGTLLSLQAELYLLERKVARVVSTSSGRQILWSTMEPFAAQYADLLQRYPADILKQQDQAACIKLRQASLYLYLTNDHTAYKELTTRAMALCEQALAEAPEALFRVEALETLANLAGRCDQKKKEIETYRKLYAITGKDPVAAVGRKPAEYLMGILAAASTDDLATEAAKAMDGVIAEQGEKSEDVRAARFYRAELYFMKQRYVQAASEFTNFVHRYGPPQNPDGTVSSAWNKPPTIDPQLEQVYEAALRVAHCWRTQNAQAKSIEAYRWIVNNLNHLNPRVAEAWYTILTTGVDPAKLTATAKEDLARQLWTRIVNNSLDTGSKAFGKGYYPWVRSPDASIYVKAAILRAGEYFADSGKHKLAGDLFREYTLLFRPDDITKLKPDEKPQFTADNQLEIAAYAAGKEYLLAKEYKLAVEMFRAFLDTLPKSKFRIPALMALGHYGAQAEMYPDAIAAYSALLDEYGPPNPVDIGGWPVPVKVEQRLRKDGVWNGFRLPPPPQWDNSKIRFGLGFVYWKQDDWANCQTVLAPFLNSADLRKSTARPEALYMIARCYTRQNLPSKAVRMLEVIVRDHADFKAIEEIYTDMARMAFEASNWKVVSDACAGFIAKFPNSERIPYMNLYAAAAQVGSGNIEAGTAALRVLAGQTTYEDVKAGAYYHLAITSLRSDKFDLEETLDLLRKSIKCYPEDKALLQAAKCACDLKKWPLAQEFADQFTRDFPKADRRLVEDMQDVRQRITAGLKKR
ncbi:MAG: tetratricopeptide repeat protein [Kiritimatiellia bacterium]